jgi:hypothetical protein
MKKLEKYYKNGYDFTLIHREGDLAIALGKSRITGNDNWEIIEIQSHNGVQMGENWVEAAEYCPPSSSWGILGWTALNKTDAERIFQNRLSLTNIDNSSS